MIKFLQEIVFWMLSAILSTLPNKLLKMMNLFIFNTELSYKRLWSENEVDVMNVIWYITNCRRIGGTKCDINFKSQISPVVSNIPDEYMDQYLLLREYLDCGYDRMREIEELAPRLKKSNFRETDELFLPSFSLIYFNKSLIKITITKDGFRNKFGIDSVKSSSFINVKISFISLRFNNLNGLFSILNDFYDVNSMTTDPNQKLIKTFESYMRNEKDLYLGYITPYIYEGEAHIITSYIPHDTNITTILSTQYNNIDKLLKNILSGKKFNILTDTYSQNLISKSLMLLSVIKREAVFKSKTKRPVYPFIIGINEFQLRLLMLKSHYSLLSDFEDKVSDNSISNVDDKTIDTVLDTLTTGDMLHRDLLLKIIKSDIKPLMIINVTNAEIVNDKKILSFLLNLTVDTGTRLVFNINKDICQNYENLDLIDCTSIIEEE